MDRVCEAIKCSSSATSLLSHCHSHPAVQWMESACLCSRCHIGVLDQHIVSHDVFTNIYHIICLTCFCAFKSEYMHNRLSLRRRLTTTTNVSISEMWKSTTKLMSLSSFAQPNF